MLPKATHTLVLANWSMGCLLAIALDVPFAARLLVIGGYLMAAFGATVVRRIPGIQGAEALSVAIASSLALLILASQAFIVIDAYDPLLVFVVPLLEVPAQPE